MHKVFSTVLLSCLLTTLMAQYCGTSGPAVCTPQILSHPGFSPPSDSLAPFIDAISGTRTLEFQNYDTLTFGGIPLTVDSLHIDQITNLPAGLCWATNKTTNTFGNQENGCIKITGTTNASPGQYQLDILVTLYSSLGFPLTVNTSATGLYYFVRVDCSNASPVVPVDTTHETTTDTTIIYPNGGNCSGTLLNVSLGAGGAICNNSTILISPSVTGGQVPYSYAWSETGNTLSCQNCANPSVTINQTSTYTVTVTDQNHTTATASVTYTSMVCNDYCGNSGPSVCTPTPLASPGFEPVASNLPPFVDGVPATQIIEFENYDTLTFQGTSLTMDSLTFVQITNLPEGLCWASNKTNNTLRNLETGCIRITGTTNAAPGQYKLDIVLKAYTSLGIPLTANADVFGIHYFVRVNCSSSSATIPVDTTQTAADSLILYTVSGNCGVSNSFSVSLPAGQSVCDGANVNLNPALTGGSSPYTYAWSYTGNMPSCNNCAGPHATITANSTYSVTVTDSTGQTASATVSYNVEAPGLAQINGNSAITICSNQSAELYTPQHYAGYSWSNGSTTSPIMVSQQGTYYVTVTDNSGCISTGSIVVNVTQAPTALSIVGNTSVAPLQSYTYVVSQLTGITYTWSVEGGAIQSGQGTNSVNVVWAATGPNQVMLIQTNQANCTDTSILPVQLNTGINNITDNNLWQLYPNPAHSYLMLDNHNLTNLTCYHIKVVNTLGQTVYSQTLKQSETIIDLSKWGAAGVYFVTIIDAGENTVAVKRVVSQ